MDLFGIVLAGLDPAAIRVAALVVVLYFVVSDHFKVATLWKERLLEEGRKQALRELSE